MNIYECITLCVWVSIDVVSGITFSSEEKWTWWDEFKSLNEAVSVLQRSNIL